MEVRILKSKFGQVVAMSVILTMLGGFILSQASADVRPIPDAGIVSGTVIVIPNGAKYLRKIDSGPVANRYAPFGSGGGCPMQTTVKLPGSLWPTSSSTSITIKKRFALYPGAHNIRVVLSVDNDINRVKINGVLLTDSVSGSTSVSHGNCPMVDEFLFIEGSSAPVLDTTGSPVNIIEVKATDLGVESYLDLRVLVDY